MKLAPRLFVGAVTIVGIALLCFALTTQLDRIDWNSPVFWVLTACVVAGELVPIKIPRENETLWVTVSGMFAFALIITFGVPGGLIALVPASLFDDLRSKKSPWKLGFNASVYTLAATAAGSLLYAFGQLPRSTAPTHFIDSDLIVILLAGVAFFVVNWCLTNIAVALINNARVITTLRGNLGLETATDGLLLTLSPIVVAAADRSLFLIPLLALPMFAAYKAARVSQRNLALANDLRARADENRHLALHDSLTGLPNRGLFHDRVHRAVSDASSSGLGMSVLLMDIDRFKEINDALGHHNGDGLLQEVGQRLSSIVRATDTVARLGGDEFGVLIPALRDNEAVTRVAEEMLGAFERPFQLEELVLKIEASMGLAVYPQHGLDAGSLIRHADVAMYASKQSRTGYQVYESARDEHTRDRLALAGGLRQAVDAGDFMLHYQPQIDVRNGRLVGVEALLRWYHEGRLVPPRLFIPLAEHSGLIGPMTMWVIESAARQSREWDRAGIHLNIAVNLSMRNLFERDLPQRIGQVLSKGASPRRLVLEITESGIAADPVRAEAVLTELSEMGIDLSIDDFGTGHSSLSRLKRLPVDELKIDQCFVTNMTRDASDVAIVRSIIELGHNLGLRVVGEGVETAGALVKLKSLDCDIAQGFHLGRPLPASELAAWQESLNWDALARETEPQGSPLEHLAVHRTG